MNFKLLILTLMMYSGMAFASEYQRIESLGISPKGQFVALEEYGYKPQSHTYWVTIKFLNVWKKEYVGSAIHVETPAHRPINLKKARSDARTMAREGLTRFQISG